MTRSVEYTIVTQVDLPSGRFHVDEPARAGSFVPHWAEFIRQADAIAVGPTNGEDVPWVAVHFTVPGVTVKRYQLTPWTARCFSLPNGRFLLLGEWKNLEGVILEVAPGEPTDAPALTADDVVALLDDPHRTIREFAQTRLLPLLQPATTA